jgi:hypothetical protein
LGFFCCSTFRKTWYYLLVGVTVILYDRVTGFGLGQEAGFVCHTCTIRG